MTHRVLIAADGSDNGKIALMRAIEWFGADSEYHAVYVHAPRETIRIPSAIPPHAATGGLDPEHQLDQSIEERERDIIGKQLRDVMESSHVKIEIHWRRGDPRHEIVQIAEDLDVDVVVVGSRGHGSVSRLLLGSVSSFVVEHAPVSTLVVR